MENVITLGKLIGLLFCSLPLSILFLKTPKIQGIKSLTSGTIFLV